MTQSARKPIRFGSSWSTQFRLFQAIGRGLASLMPIDATVVITGPQGLGAVASGDADVAFSKSVNNEHMATGKGLFAEKESLTWLRSIAWLPQEDRFLFAVAPWVDVESFEDIAAKKPKLRMQGRAAGIVLREYGFSYDDIVSWGGSVGSIEHTAADAKAAYDRGELDACFGDGSAYDFSAWEWMANKGYRFLDISEAVMDRLVNTHRLRPNITPRGFLPTVDRTLRALDDSHIVLSCHERVDDELAYNLAKAIDLNKRDIECSSIQVAYAEDRKLPVTQLSHWSSLTGQIERQWDEAVLGAPLHPGARRYYEEIGVL